MRRHHVTSSSILSVGYDPASRILEVEFISGATYRYRQVAAQVHAALMRADSKGRFVNAHVRDCYPFDKLA